MLKAALTLALALTVASQALATEPYAGRWTRNAAWCPDYGILLGDNSYEGNEILCKMRVENRRGKIFDVSTDCIGEGEAEPFQERFTIEMQGVNTLTIISEGEPDFTFYRCD